MSAAFFLMKSVPDSSHVRADDCEWNVILLKQCFNSGQQLYCLSKNAASTFSQQNAQFSTKSVIFST